MFPRGGRSSPTTVDTSSRSGLCSLYRCSRCPSTTWVEFVIKNWQQTLLIAFRDMYLKLIKRFNNVTTEGQKKMFNMKHAYTNAVKYIYMLYIFIIKLPARIVSIFVNDRFDVHWSLRLSKGNKPQTRNIRFTLSRWCRLRACRKIIIISMRYALLN